MVIISILGYCILGWLLTGLVLGLSYFFLYNRSIKSAIDFMLYRNEILCRKNEYNVILAARNDIGDFPIFICFVIVSMLVPLSPIMEIIMDRKCIKIMNERGN